jgi:hypothetical protein
MYESSNTNDVMVFRSDIHFYRDPWQQRCRQKQTGGRGSREEERLEMPQPILNFTTCNCRLRQDGTSGDWTIFKECHREISTLESAIRLAEEQCV